MTTQKAIERSTSNTLPARQQQQPVSAGARERGRWYYSPHADIVETGEGFTIVLDMPGVSPENLEITVEDRALIVRGRVVHPQEDSRRPIRTEYGIGDYFRRFELGDTIDVDRISAAPGSGSGNGSGNTTATGVFTIRLPKIERARPIRIPVAGA